MNVVDFNPAAGGRYDQAEIQRALALMVDGIFEVRIPKAGKFRTVRGYFNDAQAATKAVMAWSGKVPAVYITLNPVNPALLARASNRLEPYAENTTGDSDVINRRWMLIDVDPKRPAGISSSQPEHNAAIKMAMEVRGWLHERGWPDPITADSGNGAHLLYRISLSNDSDNTQSIHGALQALAARFDSAAVTVDTSVFNASRISKLYGTYSCKGDNTPDRPHRLSRIMEAPNEIEFVSLELLEELAAQAPKKSRHSPDNRHSTRPRTATQGSGDFFSNVNQAAMDHLQAWVPRLFPDAKPYRDGYRVTSYSLNRNLEEDLSIQADGIKDFGIHDTGDPHGGRRTPIDLVIEHGSCRDAKEAALWLCDQLGYSPDRLGWKKPERQPEEIPRSPKTEEQQPTTPSSPSEFIALSDFIAAPPNTSYLIKRVLPARGMGQVFGSSNVGKSFLLIDFAMHIASGRPWRGYKTKKASVLYIAAEGVGGLSARMKAWTQRHQCIPDRLFIRPYSVQLTVEGAAAALYEKIKSIPYPPSLIILDTLAANFGPGDENSAEDMAKAMAGMRSLAGDWLSICVHHSGHGDKTRSRGHSSLFAAMDIEIQVTRETDQSPIKVCHTKCRDMERMDAVFFNLEPEPLPWADEDGEPINSAVLMPAEGIIEEYEKKPALSGKQSQALQLLKDLYEHHRENVVDGGTARVTVAEWYAGMSFESDKGHRSRIKKSLEDRQLIRTDNGFVYVL